MAFSNLPQRNRRILRNMRSQVPSGVLLGRQSGGEGPVEFIPIDDSLQSQLDAISATQGSILYRNATEWTALAPGTSGQFLKTNGAAANPSWDSAGGEAWWFDPPAAADFPTTVTEGSSSAVSFTDDADVGLLFAATIGTNDNAEMRVKTAPSTPFTITARMAISTTAGTGGGPGAPVAGLVLRNSGSGLRTIFGFRLGDNVSIRRATGTTFNADVASAQTDHMNDAMWLRIVVTTDTDIEYQISRNGKTYHLWQSDTANGRVAGLDQIGFAISRAGTTVNQALAISNYAEA